MFVVNRAYPTDVTDNQWQYIEKTFAWFNNSGRFRRNYEISLGTDDLMVKISAIKLLLNMI